MSVQINKEGRTRYKRKYLFPRSEETCAVQDDVYFDAPYGGRGMYWGKFTVARFYYKTLSIAFRCPHCGLQMFGIWYRDEKFVAPKSGHENSCSFESNYLLGKYNLTFKEVWASEELERKEYAKTSVRIEAEIRAVRAMKNCPICGKLLSEKYEDERENDSPREWFLEESFKDLVYKREYNSSDLSNDSIQRIKNTTSFQAVDTDKYRIINDPNLLQEYIRHLLNAETTVLTLEKRLRDLYWESADRRERYIRQLAEQMSATAEKLYSNRLRSNRTRALMPTINDVKLNEAPPIKPSFTGAPPKEPNYTKPGLFNKKKAQEQNNLLRSSYEADCQAFCQKKAEYDSSLKQYRAALEEYNRKREEVLAQLVNEYKQKEEAEQTKFANNIANIDRKKIEICEQLGSYALYQETQEDIRRTEEILAHSYSCLRSLYGCEIIYGKYRNPVALASFYDYLAAGRCTTLTGADGAYNIYENEIRMDCIITKLDMVIESLEQIKNAQYSLYTVMCEMNTSLDMLNATSRKMEDSLKSINNYQKDISNNTAVIAHNTTVTAFYAKKNAELTDALGFMVALQ